MLLRISLIVAIVAGLAVGGLNFVKVKEKITTLASDRDNEKKMKEQAQGELRTTKSELAKTSAELKTTKATLEATSAERDKAVSDLAAKTKEADRLTTDLAKTRKDRDDAQAELAAYRATDLKPEQIVAINKQFKDLQKSLEGAQDENKVLGQKITKLQTELDRYVSPDKPVFLPAGLAGKVLVTDPKWNFVILDVGLDQGIKEYGELLVNRNGKLVAKVIVRSAQKNRCVANVLPGWQLGEVMEGDQVTPAHPES
jgi:hypothetical protein